MKHRYCTHCEKNHKVSDFASVTQCPCRWCILQYQDIAQQESTPHAVRAAARALLANPGAPDLEVARLRVQAGIAADHFAYQYVPHQYARWAADYPLPRMTDAT